MNKMQFTIYDFAQSFIKHLFVIWSSTYAANRILNVDATLSFRRWLRIILATMMSAVIVALLRQFARPISVFTMVLMSVWLNRHLFDKKGNIIVVSTIMSYGLAYLFVVLASACFVLLRGLIGYQSSEMTLLSSVFIGLLQFSLTFSLFQFPRLRNGLPFLDSARYGDLGVYVCVCILTVVSFNSEQKSVVSIVLLGLCVFGLTLWFWWRSRMMGEYVRRTRMRERKELQDTISSQKEEIAALKKENEAFSKIIHKDNKLLPAMELAVHQAVYTVAHSDDPGERIRAGEDILRQLDAVSAERAGIVRNYEHSASGLSTTGIPVLDSLFSYMLWKAKAAKLSFDLRVIGPVSERLPEAIAPQDAATLLADLIENAIIATASAGGEPRVLAELDCGGAFCAINVYDTAGPIPEEVVMNWGVQRTTTHADTGGSGIGLMTAYELCRRYHAGFSVIYLEQEEYSKCVSVSFDGTEQFFVGSVL